MKLELKDWLTIGTAVVTGAVALALADYRVSQAENRLDEIKGEPLKLAFVEKDVGRMKCEIENVKLLLKQLPERFCP